MSRQVHAEPGPQTAVPRERRLRHAARDELAAAAVSLVGSVATAVAAWALLRWLG